MTLLPLTGNFRMVQQCADMLPFRQSHWSACLLHRNLHVKALEGIHENLRWRQRTEINQSAGPVKNNCLQFNRRAKSARHEYPLLGWKWAGGKPIVQL